MTLEASDVALRAVRGARAGANHLREQIYIIIGLARHLFAYGVQHFKKSWLAIHGA